VTAVGTVRLSRPYSLKWYVHYSTVFHWYCFIHFLVDDTFSDEVMPIHLLLMTDTIHSLSVDDDDVITGMLFVFLTEAMLFIPFLFWCLIFCWLISVYFNCDDAVIFWLISIHYDAVLFNHLMIFVKADDDDWWSKVFDVICVVCIYFVMMWRLISLTLFCYSVVSLMNENNNIKYVATIL